MPTTPNEELQAAMDRAKGMIRVQPYDEVVLNKSFKARVQGLWGGMALGLGWGAVTGAVAAFVLAPMLGAPMAMEAALLLCAKFSAAGLGVGALGGQIIGSSAGAAAAAAEEREFRERAEELEDAILASPKLQAQLLAEHREWQKENPGISPRNVSEMMEHSRTVGDVVKHMINWKTLLLAAALGAGVGALGIAGGMFVELLPAAIAEAPLATQMLFGAGITGLSGMAFGVNFPVLFTSIGKVTGGILSGEAFDGPKKQPELSPTLQALMSVRHGRSHGDPEVSQDALKLEDTLKKRGFATQDDPRSFQERLAAAREREEGQAPRIH